MSNSDYHRIVNFKSNGILGISKHVFKEIVASTIKEIEGCSISDKYTLIFKKPPITCKFGKADDLIIDINIRVQYGYSVSEISNQVQEKVERALLHMTEIRPKRIHVNVEDVNIQ